MSDQQQQRSFKPLLENLEKLVGIFGVFLVFSFLFGYVYQFAFFSRFDAGWLLELYSSENLISIGAPWIIFITAVATFFFNLYPDHESFRVGMQKVMFVGALLIFFIFCLVGYFGVSLEKNASFRYLEFVFYTTCVAGFIPMAIKAYQGGEATGNIVAFILGGIGLSCVFIPFMMAETRVREVASSSTPLFKSSDKVQGILLGLVGEKYIVLACADFKVVTLYEQSDEYSIAPRAGLEECMPPQKNINKKQ